MAERSDQQPWQDRRTDGHQRAGRVRRRRCHRRLLFTHAADEMGRIAAGNALRWPMRRRFRAESTPWVTFTRPEVPASG